MRKLCGLFFAVVAMFFLTMAYSRLVRAEDPTCESVLAAQIAELVNQDKSKILEMQFELTTLKLAYATLTKNRKTVEGYIRTQEAAIAKLDDREIRSKLRALYQRNGEAQDAERIQTAIQESADKAKKGRYVRKELRFKNKDLSAFVLAHVMADENSIYDGDDVAILWLQSEISEGVEKATHRGSAAANMREASTLVARLTGYAGTTGDSKEVIFAKIAALQDVIGEELDRIATTFTNEQKKACAELSKCDDCAAKGKVPTLTDEHKTGGLSQALQDIGRKLVTDDAERDAAIKKVMAQHPKIELESDDGSSSDVRVKTKMPKTTSSSIPSSPIIPSAKPETRPSPPPSNEPIVDVKSMDPVYVVATKKEPNTDTSGTRKSSPSVALAGAAELGKSYAVAKTADTILKNCEGSMKFVQDGSDVKLEFVVTDAKTFKTVCQGSYVVGKKDVFAWDDTNAQIECKKQKINLAQTCQ